MAEAEVVMIILQTIQTIQTYLIRPQWLTTVKDHHAVFPESSRAELVSTTELMLKFPRIGETTTR